MERCLAIVLENVIRDTKTVFGRFGSLQERYRVLYRLANANGANRKRLFDFLRGMFESEAQLKGDTKRLRDAIASGACTLSEWKPFSAIEKGRSSGIAV